MTLRNPQHLWKGLRPCSLLLHGWRAAGLHFHSNLALPLCRPENIVLEGGKPGGRCLLVDFGAMRQLQADEAAATQVTDAGTFTGTWGFAAPEQMRGQTQPGSDLYGLGATLVYLISGQSGVLSCACCHYMRGSLYCMLQVNDRLQMPEPTHTMPLVIAESALCLFNCRQVTQCSSPASPPPRPEQPQGLPPDADSAGWPSGASLGGQADSSRGPCHAGRQGSGAPAVC